MDLRICQFDILTPNICYFMKETMGRVEREEERK